jgi:hypothetical protein
LGWVDFFLLSTVATVPALALLVWMMRSAPSLGTVKSPPVD